MHVIQELKEAIVSYPFFSASELLSLWRFLTCPYCSLSSPSMGLESLSRFCCHKFVGRWEELYFLACFFIIMCSCSVFCSRFLALVSPSFFIEQIFLLAYWKWINVNFFFVIVKPSGISQVACIVIHFMLWSYHLLLQQRHQYDSCNLLLALRWKDVISGVQKKLIIACCLVWCL